MTPPRTVVYLTPYQHFYIRAAAAAGASAYLRTLLEQDIAAHTGSLPEPPATDAAAHQEWGLLNSASAPAAAPAAPAATAAPPADPVTSATLLFEQSKALRAAVRALADSAPPKRIIERRAELRRCASALARQIAVLAPAIVQSLPETLPADVAAAEREARRAAAAHAAAAKREEREARRAAAEQTAAIKRAEREARRAAAEAAKQEAAARKAAEALAFELERERERCRSIVRQIDRAYSASYGANHPHAVAAIADQAERERQDGNRFAGLILETEALQRQYGGTVSDYGEPHDPDARTAEQWEARHAWRDHYDLPKSRLRAYVDERERAVARIRTLDWPSAEIAFHERQLAALQAFANSEGV